jgi:HD-GYP domain-containing protein (c-di-GMP phosphodiesterase class II)
MVKPDLPNSFLRELAALYRLCLLYPPTNERVRVAAERAASSSARCGCVVRLSLFGKEVVLQDRELGVSGPLQGLIRAIQRSGYESVRFERTTTADDLLAWINHLSTGGAGGFGQGGVTAGYLDLADRPVPPTSAVFDHLALLPKLEEAFALIGQERPEGLVTACEIVRVIAVNLADRPDLFQPVHVLKGHDNYTFTHALNVCALTTAMGRALGVSEELLDALSLAALCHDVGKQKVPLSVLNRRGPLDADERRIMDGHPVFGARLLVQAGEIDGLSPMVPVVAFQHHMGLNRSGYPQMPQPGTLHPASLVVAVADVFDALRTVRPYRPARSPAAACTVLIEDTRAGKLHPLYISTLMRLSRIIVAGRGVALSDGQTAVVLEPGVDPLLPLVETEGGGQVDLTAAGAPTVIRILEEAAPRPADQ